MEKLEEIKEAIKKWDASRDDAPKMDALFKEGNCFKFKTPDDIALDDEEFIHAYVSVIKNGTSDTLTMLLIESNKDNNKQDRIQEYVKKITVDYELIPKEDIVEPPVMEQRINPPAASKDTIIISKTIVIPPKKEKKEEEISW